MPLRRNYSDDQLLQALQDGSDKAFVILYHNYGPMVTNFIKKFVKSSELANDLSQEVFLKVWEDRVHIGEVRSLRSWLFTLSKNHTLNYLKRAAVDGRAKAAILQSYKMHVDSSEEELMADDYMQYIQRTIKTLPPRTREVFRLCREEHHTNEETAAKLGISRNAVKKHMIRSIKLLKAAVERGLGISISIAAFLLSLS